MKYTETEAREIMRSAISANRAAEVLDAISMGIDVSIHPALKRLMLQGHGTGLVGSAIIHDAITISMPTAIAKVLALPDHPDRPDMLIRLSEVVKALIYGDVLAITLTGVQHDGSDMSYGDLVYAHVDMLASVHHRFRAAAPDDAEERRRDFTEEDQS